MQRAFDKAREISKWQTSTLSFLREINRIPEKEAGVAFARFKRKMSALSDNSYEQKEILYLDIPAWIESHLQRRPIMELSARQRINVE